MLRTSETGEGMHALEDDVDRVASVLRTGRGC